MTAPPRSKLKPEPERDYEAKSRLCLKCRKPFESSWPGERQAINGSYLGAQFIAGHCTIGEKRVQTAGLWTVVAILTLVLAVGAMIAGGHASQPSPGAGVEGHGFSRRCR